MRNEVYLIIFIHLLVNPSVFASLNKRSTHLTKKTYSLAKGPMAVNYCGAGALTQINGQQEKYLHQFNIKQQIYLPQFGGQQQQFYFGKNKIVDSQVYLNPNNKILLKYKKNIIYPDDPRYNEKKKSNESQKKNKGEASKKKKNSGEHALKEKPGKKIKKQFGGQFIGKVNFQQFKQSGGQAQFQKSGGQGQFMQFGGHAQFQKSGGQGQFKQFGGQAQFQKSGGQGQFMQFGGHAQFQKSGGQGQFKQFGGQAQLQKFGGQGQLEQFSGQGQLQQFGGQGQLQQFKGQGQLQQFGGQGQFQQFRGQGQLQQFGGQGQLQQLGGQGEFQRENLSGEDALNTNKFINAPGKIPTNLNGDNYITLSQSGINKLMTVITEKRWEKDHSKEKKECFADLPFYNQGSCGSCFIFSGVSFFSISRCFATGKFTSYSHQDILNCMPPSTKLGSPDNCHGGLPKFVWQYMAQNGVLEQSCQCYESHDGTVKKCNENTCKAGGEPTKTKPETQEVIHMKNINMVAYAIEYIGPLMASISINAQNVAALNYLNQSIQGKVHNDLNKLFGAGAASGQHAAHAVVIVGYRVRTDRQECSGQSLIDPNTKDFKKSCVHIKIMNSWASEFGKNGYAWIPSEMLDWAEVAFPTHKQLDDFKKLIDSGDVIGSNLIFAKTKYRLDSEN